MREVVCIIEIVSPGNKASRPAVRALVEKTRDFLQAGVNVLLVDPLPPGPNDPGSLHKLIWDEIEESPFEMPADEPLLLAAYRAGDDAVGLSPVAYLEPFRVGAAMPDMPAWIDPDSFVEVPLERTYQSAGAVCPADFRYLVEHGRLIRRRFSRSILSSSARLAPFVCCVRKAEDTIFARFEIVLGLGGLREFRQSTPLG